MSNFIYAMREFWNVDATGCQPVNTYYEQEQLTKELIAKGKIVDPNKDCTFMNAWGKQAQKDYEHKRLEKRQEAIREL